MARKGIDPMLIVGILVVMGLVFFATGGKIPAQVQPEQTNGFTVIAVLATVRASVVDAISAAVPANMNSVLVQTNPDGSLSQIATADITARGTSVSTGAPNTLNGFIMLGNDNFAGGTTDRGAEYYYRKIPIKYVNLNSYDVPEQKIYAESVTTLAGFDDNVAEIESDTLSIAVGSGATVDTSEMRITVGTADAAFGNPDLSNPVGVCLNTTATGLTVWNADEVRPINHAGKFATPGFLIGQNVLGCYRLPIPAMTDSPGGLTTYRFPIRFSALAGIDPTAASNVSVMLMDETWHINDQSKWQIGFGDDSELAADTDLGVDSRVPAQVLTFGVS